MTDNVFQLDRTIALAKVRAYIHETTPENHLKDPLIAAAVARVEMLIETAPDEYVCNIIETLDEFIRLIPKKSS